MGLLISILILGSVVLIAYSLLPQFLNKAKNWQKDEERKVAKEMDAMFYDKSPRKIVLLYFILPEIFGIAAFIITRSIIVAI
ncbi:MAG: hypothetical protein NTW13_04935, partial [Candidatus Omnitrophica bacterium]|nr:hypothetical protein [Candidatus Omnitrophota bacterium]